MQQASVQALLGQILHTNISSQSMDRLQDITSLVNDIAATVSCHEAFCSKVLIALSKSELQHHVEAFLNSNPTGIEEHHYASCISADIVIRQACLSATISMLLTAFFAGQDQNLHVPSSLGVALVRKQRQLSMLVHQCTHKAGPQVSGRISRYVKLSRRM